MPPAPTERRTIPRVLRASPGFLLGKAAQRGAELAEQALRPLDLKARHYGVLVALAELGSLAQHELGELLRIDRTTMVAIVDHLERQGFVRRLRSADRRTYQIQLTGAGTLATEQARRAIAAADAALVSRLSTEERAELARLVGKLCGAD